MSDLELTPTQIMFCAKALMLPEIPSAVNQLVARRMSDEVFNDLPWEELNRDERLLRGARQGGGGLPLYRSEKDTARQLLATMTPNFTPSWPTK